MQIEIAVTYRNKCWVFISHVFLNFIFKKKLLHAEDSVSGQYIIVLINGFATSVQVGTPWDITIVAHQLWRSVGSPTQDHTPNTATSTYGGSVKHVAHNDILQLQLQRSMLCQILSETYSGLIESPASTCSIYRYDQPATACTFHPRNLHFHLNLSFDFLMICKTVTDCAPVQPHHSSWHKIPSEGFGRKDQHHTQHSHSQIRVGSNGEPRNRSHCVLFEVGRSDSCCDDGQREHLHLCRFPNRVEPSLSASAKSTSITRRFSLYSTVVNVLQSSIWPKLTLKYVLKRNRNNCWRSPWLIAIHAPPIRHKDGTWNGCDNFRLIRHTCVPWWHHGCRHPTWTTQPAPHTITRAHWRIWLPTSSVKMSVLHAIYQIFSLHFLFKQPTSRFRKFTRR